MGRGCSSFWSKKQAKREALISSNTQRYDLGDDVRDHLRKHLHIWNYRTLTERLTDTLDLGDGALFAHLPLGLTLEDLSITALQRVKESTYDMYPPLIELTKQHLEKDDAVWIVPDVMLYRDEVDNKVYAPLTLTYKNEVYRRSCRLSCG